MSKHKGDPRSKAAARGPRQGQAGKAPESETVPAGMAGAVPQAAGLAATWDEACWQANFASPNEGRAGQVQTEAGAGSALSGDLILQGLHAGST